LSSEIFRRPISEDSQAGKQIRPAFEVVSIKHSGGLTPGRVPRPIRFRGGRLSCDETLARLITIAYHLQSWEYVPPVWQMMEYYEVNAIAPTGASEASRDLMLQTMLEQRLHLIYHRQEAQVPIYALTVEKGGLKLQLGTDSDSGGARRVTNGIYASTASSLSDLASFLTMTMDRPVLDETGLSGKYRMNFDWSDALHESRPSPNEADRSPGMGSRPPAIIGLSLARGFLKKGGLRLDPRVALLKKFVIDHVNVEPTPNCRQRCLGYTMAPDNRCDGLTIGAFLEALPGDRYRTVRAPPRSLAFRLQRLLFQQLQPGAVEAVRGIGVAGDNLLHCLLKHSTAQKFALFVEPGSLAGEQAQAALRERGILRPGVTVGSRAKLLSGLPGDGCVDAWLDIYGTAIESYSLRSHFATRLFPITTLQHAFSPHHLLYERFLRMMLMGSYPCDSIICTSRAGKRGIEALLNCLAEHIGKEFNLSRPFKGRVDAISLCVDTESFEPSDKLGPHRVLNLPRDAVILVYVGYLSPMKADLVPLLTVFQRLVRENPQENLLLLLVGTGWPQYQEMILNRAREANLQSHVKFLTNVSDENKRVALRAADIFVSPSDTPQEAFGLTPVEAMASGIPQVVSDWNGYRDTVRDGETGFLIPTYWTNCDDELVGTGDLLGWRYDHMVLSQSLAIDLYGLFHALQELIRSEDLRRRMASASRKLAVREYSYSAVACRYDDLWRELAGQARAIGHAGPAPRFDQPSYSAVFRHYATHDVTDETMISRGEWGAKVRSADTQSANAWGRPVIDECIVDSLMDVLEGTAEGGSAGLPVRSLIAGVATRGHKGSAIRRHVLWLLKYGFLRIQ
jgi:D-inositol-3-phosphate glycosyltransferase